MGAQSACSGGPGVGGSPGGLELGVGKPPRYPKWDGGLLTHRRSPGWGGLLMAGRDGGIPSPQMWAGATSLCFLLATVSPASWPEALGRGLGEGRGALVLLQDSSCCPLWFPCHGHSGNPKGLSGGQSSAPDTRWLRGSARFSSSSSCGLSSPPRWWAPRCGASALPAQRAALADWHSLAPGQTLQGPAPGQSEHEAGKSFGGRGQPAGDTHSRDHGRRKPSLCALPCRPRPPGHEALLSPEGTRSCVLPCFGVSVLPLRILLIKKLS